MNFADRYLSNVRIKLVETIDKKCVELGAGTIASLDPAETGMKYTRAAGVIQGLKTALALFDEVEREMSMKPKRGNE